MHLSDTPLNRSSAELKAKLIERDIAAEIFDPTLIRYKPITQQGNDEKTADLTVVELFNRFTLWKTSKVDDRTIEKCRALLTRLREHFGDRKASTVGESEGERFKDWLIQRQQPVTVQDRLSTLRSCWRWGLKQGWISENPWQEVKLKIPPQQRVKPFTLQEIKIIIQTFRVSKYYDFYADFVEFLFGTGCRTGEAIGLQWKHVSDDCSSVWIGEIVTKGKRKAVKTYRPRTVPLTPRLQEILLNRKPKNHNPEGLVFPAPEGGCLRDNNFRKRPWKKVLEQAEIVYRKPYITRSTLVSHALDQGLSPLLVAELTGHSVQVIYRSYAGNIQGFSRLPDILPSSPQGG
jgi:integrase